MASKTKNAPATEAAPSASQPWAKPEGGNGGGANAVPADTPADSTSTPPKGDDTRSEGESAVVDEEQGTIRQAEVRDQLTPTGDPAPEEQVRGEDGEVAAEDKDQVTPTGPSPKEVDAAAEALTPDSNADRVQAEAKDQITPVGVDESSAVYEMLTDLGDLSEEEQEEFTSYVNQAASEKLNQIKRRRKAVAMEASFVDGNTHFGTRVANPNPPPRDDSEKRMDRRRERRRETRPSDGEGRPLSALPYKG